jgi:hypothetical protein
MTSWRNERVYGLCGQRQRQRTHAWFVCQSRTGCGSLGAPPPQGACRSCKLASQRKKHQAAPSTPGRCLCRVSYDDCRPGAPLTGGARSTTGVWLASRQAAGKQAGKQASRQAGKQEVSAQEKRREREGTPQLRCRPRITCISQLLQLDC